MDTTPIFDMEFVCIEDAETMLLDLRTAITTADLPHLPASQHPVRTYLAGLSRASQPTQADALAAIALYLSVERATWETLPWWLLRRQHVTAVRAWLVETKAVATGKRYMAALRGVLKECWRLELMTADEYHRAIDVKPIRGGGEEQAAGRALSTGEQAAILAVCAADQTPAGPRDACLFGLAVRCGLRRAEIAALDSADYAEGVITVRKGKGRKSRTVPVPAGLDLALADWLRVRGDAPGALFAPVNKGGAVQPGAGISDAAIYDALQKRAEQAGVRHFSPHDLRRTYIGDLLDAGADLATVQRLAGHSQANTTAGYDRRGERAKRDAAARLHMAWKWEGGA
jgi:integrase